MFKESKFQEKHVRILVFNEETCTCMKLRDNYLYFIMSFSGDHVSWSIMWFFVVLIVVIFSKGIILFFWWHKTGVCIYHREKERERDVYMLYCMIWFEKYFLWPFYNDQYFLGWFQYIVVVSTIQLKWAYNTSTSLREGTCNEWVLK